MSKFMLPSLKGGKLRFYHWAVVLSSLFITFIAWHTSREQYHERLRSAFQRQTGRILTLIEERMSSYADSLLAGVAFYGVNNEVNYHEWKKFAEDLQIGARYPGINGIGVIYKVEKEEVDEFLAVQRKLRPRFQIHPHLDQETYWPITYLIPVEGNEEAIGLDISFEENRLKAAIAARETGQTQITAPVVLVQDNDRTPGFLFYAPFYAEKISGLEQEFGGLVYAPFVFRKLLYGALKEKQGYINIKVADDGVVLYDQSQEPGPSPLTLRFTKSLEMYGRKWEFTFTPTKAFLANYATNQPIIILGAGLIIDLLLIALFLSMAKSSENAMELANAMNKEAERQRKGAAQATKLAALGEMAGGIAHEINTPLNVILSYANLLQENWEDKEAALKTAREAADKIETSVNNITSIVEGLRNFSRDGSQDKFEIEDINQVVESTLDFAKEGFQRHRMKLSYVTCGRVSVECRKIQISQVLINLLNNAKQAAQASKEREVIIELKKDEQKKRAIIEVANTGDKISEEIAHQIFQPFFTTKPPGEGTGLGLSISKSIIEAHGGELYLDLSREKTTFVIELPLA